MHSVAAFTDPHPPDAGTTAACRPPIGPYRRVPVKVHRPDPNAPEVAGRLIALIATRWPATPAEHVGSSAVPGLAGKNIIDLLLAAEPADIPAVTQALLALGFQHQLPAVFPASRPMLWGTFRDGATDYRVHVHVVPASSPEVTAMRGFRDALRSDPSLRRRYAALKRTIVEGGPVDPVVFSNAKHDWIVATLGQLGLTRGRQRRLYENVPPPRKRTTSFLTSRRPLSHSPFRHAAASGTAEAAHAAERRQQPDHGSQADTGDTGGAGPRLVEGTRGSSKQQ
jgi:GrpB-like predicted nucleotidyltransferase (UPF0157 family)